MIKRGRIGLKEILFIIITVLLIIMIILKIIAKDTISIIILIVNLVIIVIVIFVLKAQREKMLLELDKEFNINVEKIKNMNKPPSPKNKK